MHDLLKPSLIRLIQDKNGDLKIVSAALDALVALVPVICSGATVAVCLTD